MSGATESFWSDSIEQIHNYFAKRIPEVEAKGLFPDTDLVIFDKFNNRIKYEEIKKVLQHKKGKIINREMVRVIRFKHSDKPIATDKFAIQIFKSFGIQLNKGKYAGIIHFGS